MPNRLAQEKSPYLLQHKDNPVDWYPWGSDAFSRAKAEDKPVFLSIGYSTCHWCHVMEHESFEKTSVADVLNRDFVSIKVDREERPDVDDIYMTAVQTMTGSGGWPLSLFLTPEGKPFYGGTYVPPDDRHGRPGFVTLLQSIAAAWKTRRAELEDSASQLLAHVNAAAAGLPEGARAGPAALEKAARFLAGEFDSRRGGFGGAPKFPPSMRLEFLIRYWLRTKEPSAREMAETTLTKMAAGGMYDQVGGGFHRYSVDAQWLVPHFEKMLYDNAMLARAYVLAHRAFGGDGYARVAREILDYLLAEMTPQAGGFFAAQDADSEGGEGAFYVWNPRTLEDAVGPEAAPIVAARFGVTAAGNFEGAETVLSVVRSVPELAAEFGRPEK
ncbi:MAG TPA: thioredoxin domain-containing protein, partial [Thermoanaerobaculia bacterium]|nr:thioredoxin domain-containing protein [Thermoanaerobaculia bacterium]